MRAAPNIFREPGSEFFCVGQGVRVRRSLSDFSLKNTRVSSYVYVCLVKKKVEPSQGNFLSPQFLEKNALPLLSPEIVTNFCTFKRNPNVPCISGQGDISYEVLYSGTAVPYRGRNT